MRNATLKLDIGRDVRASSIIEEIVTMIERAGPSTRRYLAVSQVTCGASSTVPNLQDFLDSRNPNPVSVETLADAVLEWAKTPGLHGGNPYMHDFVRLAMRAKGEDL